jgi:hypothetical protein
MGALLPPPTDCLFDPHAATLASSKQEAAEAATLRRTRVIRNTPD